jgi:hypothetical protein
LVLLHYLVVPGIGDTVNSRSRATAVRKADEATEADGGDRATTAVAVPADSQPPVAATPFAA